MEIQPVTVIGYNEVLVATPTAFLEIHCELHHEIFTSMERICSVHHLEKPYENKYSLPALYICHIFKRLIRYLYFVSLFCILLKTYLQCISRPTTLLVTNDAFVFFLVVLMILPLKLASSA